MTLVVFLRGVNVGGHRSFRPSILATRLAAHDVVNVGAAGTLVVRKPGPRAKFLAKLRRNLPFDTEIAICGGDDLVGLCKDDPFGSKPPRQGVVRFVSILPRARRGRLCLPAVLPQRGQWHVRILGARGPFVFGMYRRHMKTIGYLGQLDKLLGAPATTRGWNTILSVLRILEDPDAAATLPRS